MARTADPDLAERRRGQIMDAALACFRRRGFHQTSMQEICAEANLSPGALYRYFPSKTDIITAISAADAHTRCQVIAQISSDELIDRLVDHAERFVAKGKKYAPLIADIMAETLRDPDLATRMRAGYAPMHALLIELIADGQARGTFDTSLDPQRAARWVIGAFDGVTMRFLMQPHVQARAMRDELHALLMRLLAPQGAAAPTKTSRAMRKETV
jgi:TetR/AcrR family transcriptional regulator, repressor for uid operon